MSCDNYRDLLLDEAAGDTKGQIMAHVEECSRCRATLREEQALFSAIDQALQARMAEVPRDGFLADVRARISLELEPRSLMNPLWILATASVMVAMLAMIVPWTTRLRREPDAVSRPTLSTAHAGPEAKVAESKPIETPHARIQRQGGKWQIVALDAAREPEVLVPPDEREALARFITHLRERDEVVVAFASPAVDEKNEPAEIQPLEVAQLQVKPLKWESWVLVTNVTVEEER